MTRVVHAAPARPDGPGDPPPHGPAADEQDGPLSAGFVLRMPPERRHRLRAARNVAAVISLIGFLGSSDWLVRATLDGPAAEWSGPGQQLSYLVAVSALNACFVLNGMIVTHTVLRHPPRMIPGMWVARIAGCLAVLLPGLALHALIARLDPAGMTTPRLYVAMVIAYPLVATLTGLVLTFHPLRRHAAAISALVLVVWLGWALAVGPQQLPGTVAAVADPESWSGGLEPTSLVMVLSLGSCFFAGTLVVTMGDLLDGRGPVFRWSLRIAALVGFVLMIPPAVSGASVADLLLAVALTSVLDLRVPQALGRHDLSLGILVLGWPLSIALSRLLTGQPSSVPGSVLACALAIAGAWALAALVVRPLESALRERLERRRPPRPRPRADRRRSAR